MRAIIPAILIFGSLAGLITMAAISGAIPELQVREVLADGYDGGEADTIKVHGMIESIEQDHRPLKFTMRDKVDPTLRISVEIDAARPDIFDVDKDVAVIGSFDPASRSVLGDKIYTKCPSKYEATDSPDGADGYDNKSYGTEDDDGAPGDYGEPAVPVAPKDDSALRSADPPATSATARVDG